MRPVAMNPGGILRSRPWAQGSHLRDRINPWPGRCRAKPRRRGVGQRKTSAWSRHLAVEREGGAGAIFFLDKANPPILEKLITESFKVASPATTHLPVPRTGR